MSSFLSFANNFLTRVFALETYSVAEVRIEDYLHYDILAREDSLILHSYSNETSKENFEIVLHKENQSRNAFSIYRSTNGEEGQIYFLRLSDKLPVFVQKFPNLITVSVLQELCKYINSHPSQNLAHICAYFGYVDYFKQLVSSKLDEIDPIINLQDENGKTPLHVAIETQRLNVIQAILALSPKLHLVEDEQNNILHYAAQTNQQIISTLCSAVNARNSMNDESESTETVDSVSLFELINTRNKSNFTPLYLACFNDKPTCVKELLKNGADVNGASICEHGGTEGSREELCDLNDQRVSVMNMLNVKDMKNGGTPLHWCKSAEVIEMLIDMNCNLNARNFHGDTALHNMVTRVNLDCVISLLSHGADVNAVGANGNTSLHLAVKANDISLVQALIVFGANVDVLNSSGESARHLAATSTSTNATVLYTLHSVFAKRCSLKRPNCTEGCAPDFSYNGVPPENATLLRNVKTYDQTLLETVVKSAIDKLTKGDEQPDSPKKKKVKLLCLDGGGIRGLILIQILAYLEMMTNKRVVDLFDWVAGTSTGGILALLFASGYSANQCRQIYFRFKDKLFLGMRPYNSELLEQFLQRYLGNDKKMSDLKSPKLFLPALKADRFPPDAQFFRNYVSANQMLGILYRHEFQQEVSTTEDLVWKVARATGAAPTYFSQFESFIDGGLISNNPTLDLLTEVQTFNRANHILGKEEDIVDIDLVISIGTGAIPNRSMEKLNFGPVFSISGISSFAVNLPTLFKVLVEQASQANGQVVDRAQAWCSMIQVPYFRLNPPISEEIQMDEKDNVKLVQMLWETMAYVYLRHDEICDLLALLTHC